MTRARTIRWIALIAAIAALGFFGLQQYRGANPGAQAQNAQKPSGSPAPKPVPVTIASVERADFPAYLFGLGSVQGLNTVVVRTRVDGQINKIAFQEGQLVKEGDILAEIDPRPYQAAFDQAVAKKAQDEAHLANAKLDLHRYVSLGEFATKQQTDTQMPPPFQTPKPSSIMPPFARRWRASPVFVWSTRATSSTPRPRPASSPSPRSNRSL
jgi:membrane fusion protein, multidrug efflux system